MVTPNTDPYGRTIDYLRVSVTDRCNLRCIYCMPEQGITLFPHDEILSYEEILRIAGVFAGLGVRKIRITGGEPLVRRNITFLIERLRQIQGIEDIALTTNGILLLPMIDDLKKAGLTRLNISLDTLRPDRFVRITRTDGLANVLRAIDRAHEQGLSPVKINMVVIRGINDDEIADFCRLAERLPVHVRFIEYMPWGRIENWAMDKVVGTAETRAIIENGFGALTQLDGLSTGPSRNFRIAGFPGVIGFINPVSDHFCAGCNRMRLTADGKLRPCLFSEREVDIKKIVRSAAGDEEIKKAIIGTIAVKPEHIDLARHMNGHSREMSQIGG